MRDDRRTMRSDTPLAPCPECLGDGILLAAAPDGPWAAETEVLCPACLGDGIVDACGRCGEPLRLVDGLERCHCPAEAGPAAEAA